MTYWNRIHEHLILFWEALMMMGPVNFIIAIQSVACRTDGLIGGLLAGPFDFRRNMQGDLVLWQHKVGLVLLLHQSEVLHICNRFDCCYNCVLIAYVDTIFLGPWDGSREVAQWNHISNVVPVVFWLGVLTLLSLLNQDLMLHIGFERNSRSRLYSFTIRKCNIWFFILQG